jgi:hypothetical protein
LKPQKPLGWLAAAAFTLFVLAGSLSKDGQIDPGTMFFIMGLSVGAGVLAAMGFLEDLFADSVAEFHSFRWAAAGALGLVTYLGRVAALDEVNSIFHVDASALPLTLIAGTAMKVATWLFWPFAAASGLAAVIVALMMINGQTDRDADDFVRTRQLMVAISAAASCGLAALFIGLQLEVEPRLQKLYRIAHATDFSATFRCQGVDEAEFDVLFIGPEQRRVLVAPKLPRYLIRTNGQPEFLTPLRRPQDFVIRDCLPAEPSPLRLPS